MNEEDSTWKKMERSLTQEGYREGAAKGRDESFQKGFDEGFREGFKIAQQMGGQAAKEIFLNCVNGMDVREALQSQMAEASKGSCLLCNKSEPSRGKVALEQTVYDRGYDAILAEQKAHNEHLQAEIAEENNR